jgi:WD40 repeat protein
LSVAARSVRWQTVESSICGASHRRKNKPNQDDKKTLTLLDDSAVVLAVADGHGAVAHPRSAKGAQFAVEAAVEVLAGFVGSLSKAKLDIERAAADAPHRVLAAWRERVDADVLSDWPKDRQKPEKLSQPEREQLRILYGSTLIAAALTPSYAIYLHIGDGDLLVLSGDGRVTREVPGLRKASNITESLCQTDAERRFRIRAQLFRNGELPTLVLLSTDGYSNSFSSEQDFFDVGRDVKKSLENEGVESVKKQVNSWLTETSESGSGDDITVALAWRGKGKLPPDVWERIKQILRSQPALTLVGSVLLLVAAWQSLQHWTRPAAWMTLPIQKGSLNSLVFSRAGGLLLAGSSDNMMVLWDVVSKQLKLRIVNAPARASLALSADERLIASGDDRGSVAIYDAKDGHLVSQINSNIGAITSLAFSPDGDRVAAAGHKSSVMVWRIGAPQIEQTLSGHSKTVTSISFAPDGSWLVSASLDGSARIWSVAGETRAIVRSDSAGVQALAVSTDGSHIVLGLADGRLSIADTTSGVILGSFNLSRKGISALGVAPNGKDVVIGDEGGLVETTDVSSGKIVHTFSGHSDRVLATTFLVDQKRIVSGARDNTVQVWTNE